MAFKALSATVNPSLNSSLTNQKTNEEIENDALDVGLRVGATVLDFQSNVLIGVGKGLEGIYDFGASLVGGIGGLFSNDFQETVRDHIEEDYTMKLFGSAMQDSLNKYSYLKEGGIIEGVGQGIGQMLPAVAAALATGGASALGTGASAAANAASLGTMAVSAAGGGVQEAFQEGSGYGQGLLYGVGSGAVEAATEKIFGGFGKLTGAGFADSLTKDVAKTGVKRIAKEAVEEGAEEAISTLVNPILKTTYQGKEALSEYGNADYWKGLGQDALVGGLTSIAYGQTVGRLTNSTGKDADIREAMSELSKVDQKAIRLDRSGRIDDVTKNGNTNRQNLAQEKIENIRIVENTLMSASESQRKKLIKRNGLTGYFNSDGTAKASFLAQEGIRGYTEGNAQYTQRTDSEGNPVASARYASAFSDDEGVNAALDRVGTKAYTGEMNETQKKNFSDFRKAFGVLSEKSGGALKYVVSDSFKGNAALDRRTGTVVIGIDQFDSASATSDIVDTIISDSAKGESWASALIHEGTHFGERSRSGKKLSQLLSEDTEAFNKAKDEVISRGYFGEDASAADAVISQIIDKYESGQQLTKEEQQVLDVFKSEASAYMSQDVLSDESFINKLVRDDSTLGQRILNTISDIKESLSSFRSSEARSAYKKLQNAEKLYMKALSEAGEDMRSANAYMETLKGNQKNKSEVQYSLKQEKKSLNKSKPLSSGQTSKLFAELNRERVYSRQDAENIINQIVEEDLQSQFANGKLVGKSRKESIDYLWNALNRAKPGERGKYAIELADYMLQTSVAENIVLEEYEVAQSTYGELFNYLNKLRGKISTKGIESEIRNAFDDKAPAILRRWKSQSDGISPDIIAQELESLGLAKFESDSPKDIFIKINELYETSKDALSKPKKQMFESVISSEEYKSIKNNIVSKILESFEKGGTLGTVKKLIRENKNLIKEATRYNSMLNRVYEKLLKIKDWKDGVFMNSSELQPDTFKAAIDILAAYKTRSHISEEKTRDVARQLKNWYMQYKERFSETSSDPEGQVSFAYNQSIEDLLSFVSDRQGKLDYDDLYAMNIIVSYFKRFVETYNMVYKNGKMIEAKPVAEKYTSKEQNDAKRKKTIAQRFAMGEYYRAFGDPMSIMRAMDYYEEGFYTDSLQEWRDANVDALTKEYNALASVREFYKKNKNYLIQIETQKVMYAGVQIPKRIAMSLYMSLQRNQAVSGILTSGFKYFDGKKEITVPAVLDSNTKITDENIDNLRAPYLDELKKQFSKTDLDFINALSDVLSVSRQYKVDTDMNLNGFTNVEDGFYFPIRRANIARSVEVNILTESDSVTNQSFNKATRKGARGLLLMEPADIVVLRHSRGVSQYAGFANAIRNFDILFNMDISGNRNNPVSIKTASVGVWGDSYSAEQYFRDLRRDIRGVRNTDDFDKMTAKVRENYVKFTLGINAKVLLTQLSSFAAAGSILDYSSIAKGMAMSGKDVDKYCTLAAVRNETKDAAIAQGSLDRRISRATSTIKRISEAPMALIGKIDRFVIEKLFAACQVQVSSRGGDYSIGTEANKVEAGKLLEKVILETQQNSVMTERSAAMRSHNELVRAVTMFKSDAMKVFGRFLDAVGEVQMLKQKRKSASSASEIAEINRKLNSARKRAAKAGAALAISGIYISILGALFSKLYGTDDDDENEVKKIASGALGNMIGGLPVFADLYSFFSDGYDISVVALDSLHAIASSFAGLYDDVGNLINGRSRDIDFSRTVRDLVYSTGMAFGIPTKNVYRVISSALRIVSPSSWYKLDSMLYDKNLTSDLQKAIENDDEKMAETIAGIITNEKLGNSGNKIMREELARLTSLGFSVLPSGSSDSFTYNGTEYTMSTKEQNKFDSVYYSASDAIERMIQSSYYQKASDSAKAKSISYIYSVYKNLAVEEVTGEDIESKNILFSYAIDIPKLAVIVSTCNEISAETDKNGNAISGSKKSKIQRYINSLGLSAAQKYMIMGYIGYSNLNGYDTVKSFINRLSISKDQKEKLLSYSGY